MKNCILTDTNITGMPEIRHYQRRVLEGVVVVTYEQRQPGEADWQPVRLIRLT